MRRNYTQIASKWRSLAVAIVSTVGVAASLLVMPPAAHAAETAVVKWMTGTTTYVEPDPVELTKWNVEIVASDGTTRLLNVVDNDASDTNKKTRWIDVTVPVNSTVRISQDGRSAPYERALPYTSADWEGADMFTGTVKVAADGTVDYGKMDGTSQPEAYLRMYLVTPSMTFQITNSSQSKDSTAADTSWLITNANGDSRVIKDDDIRDSRQYSDMPGIFGFQNAPDEYFFQVGEQYTIQQVDVTPGHEPATLGLFGLFGSDGYTTATNWSRLDKTPFTFTYYDTDYSRIPAVVSLHGQMIASLRASDGSSLNSNFPYEPKAGEFTFTVKTADGKIPEDTEWKVSFVDFKYFALEDENTLTVVDNGEHDLNDAVGTITLGYPDIDGVRSWTNWLVKQTGKGSATDYDFAQTPKESWKVDDPYAGYGGMDKEATAIKSLNFIMPKTANLEYDGNGATAGSVESVVAGVDGTATVAENDFTREGYAFDSWNTAADGTGVKYVAGDKISVAAPLTTLYAQWTANEVQLRFDPNGGTGEVKTVTGVTDGSVTVLGADAFTREGYSFVGWNTEADGSGDGVEPGSAFTLAVGVPNTLYAQWEKVEVPVTPAPGVVSPSDKPVSPVEAGGVPVLAKTGSSSLAFALAVMLLGVMGTMMVVTRRLKH